MSIAYQVHGEGPRTIVYVPGFVSNVELDREHPEGGAFYDQLGTLGRVIRLDKRGTGMSDRVPIATLEERMDDVRSVMDAVGVERAVIWGVSEGGPMSMLFAATYPERVEALLLYGSFARFVAAANYRWMPSRAERRAHRAGLSRLGQWPDTPGTRR